MKKFLLSFLGSFAICIALIALSYMNAITKLHQPLLGYLEADKFPSFALSVVGVSVLMALIYTLISGLMTKSK